MPRFAASLAGALRNLPGVRVTLSLSSGAEILRSSRPPPCALPVDTYTGKFSLLARFLRAGPLVGRLTERLKRESIDFAVCVHPGPLDPVMALALRRLRVPFIAIAHDADIHPGDGLAFQMVLQRFVWRQAAAVAVLTAHVGERLRAQGLAGSPKRPLIHLSHPPLAFHLPQGGARPGGGTRLLMFGRLLEYKGLDLLAGALRQVGPLGGLEVRIAGSGPDSPALRALAALPWVSVENRWVPEDEIGSLLDWSDALVLPYREASQSGVAAAALAAGRWVIATKVGGLPEQLSGAARAILCEPTEASLADGVRTLVAAPRDQAVHAPDTDAAWRDMATEMIAQSKALGLPRA